jgi:two-component system sensor histidine kinase RegB
MTDGRSDWVRLHTLVLLRWGAIAGQLGAIGAATLVYGLDLYVTPCLIVIAAAILVNLAMSLFYPRNKRLSEAEATVTFLFDVVQLAALLALTGGLTNPFALLILAPAAIAATALQTRSTAFVGGATIVLVTFVAWWHAPMRFADGTEIHVPPIIEFGFWLAIVIGVVFLSLYARRVSSEMHAMSDALLATQMALAREQKLTDLGGVVAAAAHELGTPLATIKLASSELADLLADRPDLRSDAELIRAQADRCRDILRAMGRAGKDDAHLRSAPLSAVLREAAEPHSNRGRRVVIDVPAMSPEGMRQPALPRRPEIIHGLRNLIQNAVDFARTTVWIDADWTGTAVRVRIADDGPGFPPDVIGRIGDPFMRRRPSGDPRPGYEGMGLGLFIAKSLLERSGATLAFGNGADPFLADDERHERSGAIVEVVWPAPAGTLDVGPPWETEGMP